MSLTLTIHHNIHLTREQRYSLHEGNAIDVIGVSVPVWFDKNVTSEPGKEVFCRYKLLNEKAEMGTRILTDGYQIPLPNENIDKEPITDEIWRSLSEKQLFIYYEGRGVQASSKNLLDLSEGGTEYLFYREHTKLDSGLNVVHFIVIRDIEQLLDSIEY